MAVKRSRASGVLRVSASVDCALRAAVVLARAPVGAWVKGEAIAGAEDMSFRYVEHMLATLRRSGLVESQRGGDGGYRLLLPPDRVCVADVVLAVDRPLRLVGGTGAAVADAGTVGASTDLATVWCAARAAVLEVLEAVTLADLAAGFSGGLGPVGYVE